MKHACSSGQIKIWAYHQRSFSTCLLWVNHLSLSATKRLPNRRLRMELRQFGMLFTTQVLSVHRCSWNPKQPFFLIMLGGNTRHVKIWFIIKLIANHFNSWMFRVPGWSYLVQNRLASTYLEFFPWPPQKARSDLICYVCAWYMFSLRRCKYTGIHSNHFYHWFPRKSRSSVPGTTSATSRYHFEPPRGQNPDWKTLHAYICSCKKKNIYIYIYL